MKRTIKKLIAYKDVNGFYTIFKLQLKSGLHVMFCGRCCIIMPDLSNRTLLVGGKLDVLHELNAVWQTRQRRMGWRLVYKSVRVHMRQSNRSDFAVLGT